MPPALALPIEVEAILGPSLARAGVPLFRVAGWRGGGEVYLFRSDQGAWRPVFDRDRAVLAPPRRPGAPAWPALGQLLERAFPELLG